MIHREPITKICECGCNQSFEDTTINHGRHYLSERHRQAHKRALKKDETILFRAMNGLDRCGYCGTPLNLGERKYAAQARYCSRKCKAAASYRRIEQAGPDRIIIKRERQDSRETRSVRVLSVPPGSTYSPGAQYCIMEARETLRLGYFDTGMVIACNSRRGIVSGDKMLVGNKAMQYYEFFAGDDE